MLTFQAGLEQKFSPFQISTCTGLLRACIAVLLLLSIASPSSVASASIVPAHASAATQRNLRASWMDVGGAGHDYMFLSGSYDRTQSAFPPVKAHPNAQFYAAGSSTEALSSLPRIPGQETKREDGGETVILYRRKSIAAKIRDAFHRLGHKIKHAFQKVGHAIKHAFQKVGQGIKHAAQKVGHFFKETGKKIAKVALKIVATVGKVVSKVVGFIPGVGKAVGKVIEAGSEGLNKASDAIHAHIGGKLGRAMERMDKAQKVVGYIP